MMVDLMRLTLRDPRQGLRAVLALRLDGRARWQAVALIAVVTTLLSGLVALMFGVPMPEAPVGVSPLMAAVLQAGGLVLGAALIHVLGRAAGGQGQFADALLAVVWLQVFLIALQLAQIVVLLVIPPVADLMLLATVAAFFWLLTHFVAELHGFRNLLLVFGAILGALLLLGILLAPVLAPLMGIEVPDV